MSESSGISGPPQASASFAGSLLELASSRLQEALLVGELDEQQVPRLLAVNEAFSLLTGFSQAETLGRSPEQLLAPASGTTPSPWVSVTAFLRTGTPFTLSLPTRCTNGRTFWGHLRGEPLPSSHARPTWSLTLFEVRDFQESLLKLNGSAERELQAIHLLLSSVFETVPFGLCVLTAAGRIVQCNRGFSSMLGAGHSPLEGTEIGALIDTEKLKPGSRDLICQRFNAERFPAHLSVTTLPQGQESWMLITLADQTERNAMDARLREAQRLESLGTLAGGIAHDFNNLLSIILGYSSLLRQSAPENERVTEYADVIIEASRRGADVVRQLMLYANQHEPLIVQDDVHLVLANLLVRLTPDWPEEIRLDSTFHSQAPLIHFDPDQITRCVEHLLRNAREAIDGTGRVTLETNDIPPHSPGEDNGWLEIAVGDNGCGMDEQTRTRMFEPFFVRNKGPAVRGFGLALVYGIMRAHHGRIEVESAPGNGTRVRLLLPRPAPVAPPKKSPESNYALRRGCCILMVEDEADIGRLWTRLFDRQGWELHWARDSDEALALFKSLGQRVDLVFSDIGLPGSMDGWQLCAAIREMRPGIPLLFASGFFKREGDEGSPQIAAPVAYIGKPCQPAEVLSQIRQMVEFAP